LNKIIDSVPVKLRIAVQNIIPITHGTQKKNEDEQDKANDAKASFSVRLLVIVFVFNFFLKVLHILYSTPHLTFGLGGRFTAEFLGILVTWSAILL
jgi:hypothetical protein